MLVFNEIEASKQIIDQIAESDVLVGAQIFTRHLSKSIADLKFFPILEEATKKNEVTPSLRQSQA